MNRMQPLFLSGILDLLVQDAEWQCQAGWPRRLCFGQAYERTANIFEKANGRAWRPLVLLGTVLGLEVPDKVPGDDRDGMFGAVVEGRLVSAWYQATSGRTSTCGENQCCQPIAQLL